MRVSRPLRWNRSNRYKLTYTLFNEKTHRFCASPRVTLLSKPVLLRQGVAGGTSFGRCAVRSLVEQSVGTCLSLKYLYGEN